VKEKGEKKEKEKEKEKKNNRVIDAFSTWAAIILQERLGAVIKKVLCILFR
jgi:hypothetical protein